MFPVAAPYPYYSEYLHAKRVESARKKNAKNAPSQSAARPPTSGSVANATEPGSASGLNADMAGLLEPAIDGPPSPERLRALNKQAKQAAKSQKHRSHHPAPSASSTHNSSDRPWDQVLDNIPLSRRSSGRSTSSSMPSRERPDSVQLFGKAIFGRKGRLKRDSSTNSSSASSLYSGETPLDSNSSSNNNNNMLFSAKDHLKPGIFGRRRAAKSDPYRDASPTPATLKKHSISGPYNFQHVTHTQRNHVPALERASRMGSVTDFPTLNPDDSCFPDLPADGSFATEFPGGAGAAVNVEPHTRIQVDKPRVYTTHVLPRSGPRRLVKSSKSQDQIRVPPPRPPRPAGSPLLETHEPPQAAAAPVPPPRLSSRQSIKYGAFDPLATTTLARPQTSGGFRQPEPFHFAPESSPPPPTAHGSNPSADFSVSRDSYFHLAPAPQHAVTTPDEEAWPLTPTTTATTATTQDGALPDVPEEDEAPRTMHKSHRSQSSVVSTSSSVRRSRSVPQLRRSTQHADLPESAQRPTSAGSDTLGGDRFTAQRALGAPAQEHDEAEPGRSNWEDDIDYCYENELEADCEYEWARASIETCRDDVETPYLTLSESRPSPGQTEAAEPTSRLLLTPDNDDVPALSPASQGSHNDPEAITPTTTGLPAPSPSFSSRRPGPAGLGLKKTRPVSTASSFKESHGFTLSPSLLIPADYQQQMMLSTSSDSPYDGSEPVIVDDCRYPSRLTATTHSAVPDRISTSTLGTDSSRSAASTADRHESTSTAFTRFTGDEETWSPKSEANPRTECSFVETLIPGPPPELDGGLAVPDFNAGLMPGVGRPRAKTTSLATPQRSQFLLFPRSPSMRRL